MLLKCICPEGRAIKGFVEFVFPDRTSFGKELEDGAVEVPVRGETYPRLAVVTGMGRHVAGWPLLPGARRLAVISPFVRATALEQLAKEADSNAPLTLVSRAKELSALPTAFASKRRSRHHVLHEGLFDELGEDSASDADDARGELHAKIYLADYAEGRGGNLAIVVGSANATRAALIDQHNVEIMVRLTGRHGAFKAARFGRHCARLDRKPWTRRRWGPLPPGSTST